MSYVIGLIWLGATLLFMYMVFQKMEEPDTRISVHKLYRSACK